MANIVFNNKNYSLNDSLIAAYSASLKQHLSTVMNGTGAVINLGGVTYNIDATKLANARNAFIQHLGSISGNGYKVVIGGVEYGIDATKMAKAVAGLDVVWEGLQNGGSGDDEIDLNPDDGSTPKYGDVYKYGDYIYTYNGGWWKVAINEEVTDKNQTSYGIILRSINGSPVANMDFTFAGCTKLSEAPVIPNGVTNMSATFQNCTSLIAAPAIPDSVTNMTLTFAGCAELSEAPVIPDSVTNIYCIFRDCAKLSEAPVIPDSVTNMSNAFENCRSLAGVVIINAEPTIYDYCFKNVDMSKITLTGTSTMLNEIGATGKNWTPIT